VSLLRSGLSLLLISTSLPAANSGQRTGRARGAYALDTVEELEVINTKAEAVTYRGRRAVHLIDLPGQANEAVAGGNTIAVLAGSDFKDGTIEVDVAGAPRAGAVETARGFIGIAFHVQRDRARYECFYLRPTNGRADDQLRRNHATQFIAEPEFPWQRLRSETPGVYESYVDLEPGAWTHMRIVVEGTKARLYVNGAKEPALIVNDMKHSETHGAIALWIGLDTDGFFSKLNIE
jgi:hypothetical protein